ncbi:GDP-mannose 4,6-dehydratase [Streptomyces sp. NBC_00287]|uniref:GDP-mannose 4,6-dehydratase n=1 Tax=Streptomyces sp. NBC_00287 TaxID=2975702 RepID=UPI002E2C6FD2|nr:GDP-mannose 4,6-dehydratase [Streptomyces sp. NBC_00287]
MRVVVSGASGFIGSQLCAFLRSRNEEVMEIDLPHCDISDTAQLTRSLEEVKPDYLYHLAAQASVGQSWQNPARTWHSNAWGTLSLLKAVRAACPTAKTVVMSSAAVFDGARLDSPIDEARTPAPLSPYGASKVAVESMARHYVAVHGLQVVIVRPFNVIGPTQAPDYLVPALARRIVSAVRSGRTHITVGNLTARRDFLDVRDAVQGLEMIMRYGWAGEAYNLCTGVGVPVRRLVETMILLADSRLEYRQDPVLTRGSDPLSLVGDPGKTRSLTGWQSSIPLATTLRDVLDATGKALSVGRGLTTSAHGEAPLS